MNPAVDKTVEIDSLVRGGLNRIERMEYDAGGKGINVSKTICELGGKSFATGFLGGNTGKIISGVLKEKGIDSDFIWVDGETRTNTKIYEKSGKLTELNEPGPLITEEKIADLMDKLQGYADRNSLFVLSGSLPDGVPADIYATMICRLHERGAKVLLDADGEAFRFGAEAIPDLLKPNRMELEKYAGLKSAAPEEKLLEIAGRLKKRGVNTVVISLGEKGAIFLLENNIIKSPALSVNAHSTVGAGDAMVGGLALSWEKKFSQEETVRLCMAVSAGAVMTIGTKPPVKKCVEVLKKKVVLQYM